MEQARLHGIDRTVHDRRDFLAGVTQLVTQLHRETLLHRQLLESLSEPVAQFLGAKGLVVSEWFRYEREVLLLLARRRRNAFRAR
jgi:hypothetical protein